MLPQAEATFAEVLALAKAGQGRQLIAVAGPPAAGKTTIAARLAEALGPRALALPMDGFHRDNADLEAAGLLARKGAAETFDAAGFVSSVQALTRGEQHDWPGFDREADAVVPSAVSIGAAHEIFVLEGNYLLLDQAPWSALQSLWTLALWVDVPSIELERRLIVRWLDHGLGLDAAKARARSNDMVNADFIRAHSDLNNARFLSEV